jgi:hypothetical protein
MTLLSDEVTWLRWLLADFGVSVMTPTPLLSDSTSTISIACDLAKNELTKHIGVDGRCAGSAYCVAVCAFKVVVDGLLYEGPS